MASRVMGDFAERTGIALDAPPRWSLWTDACAAPNAIDLYGEMHAAALLDAATGTADLGWASAASPAREEPFQA
jgi:hypothetical protein